MISIRRIIIQTTEIQVEEILVYNRCKHPIIASGATPIGSADRAPDGQIIRRVIFIAG
jgi:hypothetical protein